MASQPSKSLRNDLGRATLTVLPVGYSQNGFQKRNFASSLHGRLQVSNFSRNSRKLHARANSTFLFPLPPNEASLLSALWMVSAKRAVDHAIAYLEGFPIMVYAIL